MDPHGVSEMMVKLGRGVLLTSALAPPFWANDRRWRHGLPDPAWWYCMAVRRTAA